MKSWEDITGWFNHGDLYDQVVETFPGGTLVEVGTFLGRSLCYLTQKASESGKSFRVIGVDTCRGSGDEVGADTHKKNLVDGTFAGALHSNVINCGFADDIDLMIMPSVKAASLFRDRSLDFVFIDARHDYESVKADITAWLPKVRVGGWLTGHDYHPGCWDGVVQAVHELLPGFGPTSLICWHYIVR